MSERFSASVAGRHMACPASAHLELAIPNFELPEVLSTDAADRGTAKHEMLEPIWQLPAKEMKAMAQAIEYVAELRSTRRFKVLIEEKMTAEWLDSKPKTTADIVLYTQDEMHILDGKWGKIPVDAANNTQLLYYDATYGHLAPKAKGITNHIFQPLIGEYQSVFVTADEIAQFMDEARAAEAKILAGDTTFGPSDHCKFCPAFPHTRGIKGSPLCPTTMQLLYPKTEVDEDAILDA